MDNIMGQMMICLRRAWRLWLSARENARKAEEWWKAYVKECDEAPNPMRVNK